MDAAIGRIEQACQQFTHPGTRQQGENELLAMNEALSPNEIPLLTIAVLGELRGSGYTEIYRNSRELAGILRTLSSPYAAHNHYQPKFKSRDQSMSSQLHSQR